ncbi:response regulator [Microvirga arsenatis]|uniref:Response regulator n=1 Tax=Microvirga arsenatis TaxID=2692265 RepID=A0ABW9YZ07_9HYPH|nr:response regulator [Microvirga arsenatis]NBJ11264.1 response regulator [Microvirga arsenatis]NBJ25537.1 response regulator [Microvirga arsenatis]
MNPADDLILIVEDDPDDRDLLARAFRKAKVETPLHFAVDGNEALTFLDRAGSAPDRPRPVVILLDLKLPGRSGFEVLAWIKGQPLLRTIPVIILTSSRESVDLQRAYDLGANSYLVKPARPDELLRMVEQIDAYWLGLNESLRPAM